MVQSKWFVVVLVVVAMVAGAAIEEQYYMGRVGECQGVLIAQDKQNAADLKACNNDYKEVREQAKECAAALNMFADKLGLKRRDAGLNDSGAE